MTANDRGEAQPLPEWGVTGAAAAEGRLPGWVLRSWPRTWRETYGEEMAQTWVEAGGRRSQLLPLAV